MVSVMALTPEDALIINGAMSAGSNVAGSAGNFLSQLFFGQRSENWAREDAQMAFERQRQLLDEQRFYESPAEQMKRYVEAGLNPSLIYGQSQGSISPPGVPQAHSASTPGSMPFTPGMLDPLLESRFKQAQIERLDVMNDNDTRLTDQKIKESIAGTHLADEKVNEVRANVELVKQNRDYLRQQVDNLSTLNDREKVALSNDVVNLSKREAFIDEEFQAYASSLGLTIQEYQYAVDTYAARVLGVELDNDKLRADLHLSASKAKEIDASLPYLDTIYKAQKRQAILDAGITGQQFEINREFMKADKIFQYGSAILNGSASLLNSVSGMKRSFRPVLPK